MTSQYRRKWTHQIEIRIISMRIIPCVPLCEQSACFRLTFAMHHTPIHRGMHSARTALCGECECSSIRYAASSLPLVVVCFGVGDSLVAASVRDTVRPGNVLRPALLARVLCVLWLQHTASDNSCRCVCVCVQHSAALVLCHASGQLYLGVECRVPRRTSPQVYSAPLTLFVLLITIQLLSTFVCPNLQSLKLRALHRSIRRQSSRGSAARCRTYSSSVCLGISLCVYILH